MKNLELPKLVVLKPDHALSINPQYDSAWNNRGIALDDLGRKEEAIASYDRALELNPDNSKFAHSKFPTQERFWDASEQY